MTTYDQNNTLEGAPALYCVVMSTKPKLNFCDTEVLLKKFFAEEAERTYVEKEPSGRCWLCERQRPAVTFKKEAHVLPQGLGNRSWLTRDECDECNELVGRHESALVACLAPYRLTSSHKRGHPKFKDPKSGSFLWSDRERNLFVSESAPTGGLAEISSEGKALLRVPVDGHRPLSICKALTRIALLLIPGTRRTHRHLRKWLLGGLIFPEQALLCGELKGDATFDPCICIYRRAGDDGKDIAVALTYGGALYWYALPRNLEEVTSIFVDRSMIDIVPDLSWALGNYSEESFVPAGCATILLESPT
jgi:hypothetical protein